MRHRGCLEEAVSKQLRHIIHYVAPVYPLIAARLEMHGSILLALRVNANGSVDRLQVLRSTGSGLLDRSAAMAARQWRFAPLEDPASDRDRVAHCVPDSCVVDLPYGKMELPFDRSSRA